MTFLDLFPDEEVISEMEREELAGLILAYVTTHPTEMNSLSLQNFLNRNTNYQNENLRVPLAEAWRWLDTEGLIGLWPIGANLAQMYYVTRKGEKYSSKDSFQLYLHARLLPQALLLPDLAARIYLTYARGDYDTAVFQSFKQLEVSIRQAGGYGPTDLGVDLARKAFKPGAGPLVDPTAPLGEQEALMHLMAGALGSYKNPHSHRNVEIDAEQAAEMVALASHLIRIVRKRAPPSNSFRPNPLHVSA